MMNRNNGSMLGVFALVALILMTLHIGFEKGDFELERLTQTLVGNVIIMFWLIAIVSGIIIKVTEDKEIPDR